MANENEHEGSQETTASNETPGPSRWRVCVRTRVLVLGFVLGFVLALAFPPPDGDQVTVRCPLKFVPEPPNPPRNPRPAPRCAPSDPLCGL